MATRTAIAPQSALSNFDNLPDDALARPAITAQVLGCSIATVWRMARDGRLKKINIGTGIAGFRVGDLRRILTGPM